MRRPTYHDCIRGRSYLCTPAMRSRCQESGHGCVLVARTRRESGHGDCNGSWTPWKGGRRRRRVTCSRSCELVSFEGCRSRIKRTKGIAKKGRRRWEGGALVMIISITIAHNMPHQCRTTPGLSSIYTEYSLPALSCSMDKLPIRLKPTRLWYLRFPLWSPAWFHASVVVPPWLHTTTLPADLFL